MTSGAKVTLPVAGGSFLRSAREGDAKEACDFSLKSTKSLENLHGKSIEEENVKERAC